MIEAVKSILSLLLLISPVLATASYDGATCVQYTGSLANENLEYLRQNTLYGYVLNYIQMKPADSCAKSDKELNICIKKNGVNDWTNCTVKTLRKDGPVMLSSFDNDALKINLLSNVVLNTKFIEEANKLCVTMDTIYGEVPLVCKDTVTITNPNPEEDATCRLSEACAMRLTSSNSQLLFNFSGRMMQCVRESLDGIFFQKSLCEGSSNLNAFGSVVNYLKYSIFALLLIYTIFYGIRILLEPDKFKLEEAVIFVVKMLMVIYFTVGFQFASIFAGQVKQTPQNGVTDVLLPMFRSLSTDLAQIVFSAARTNSTGKGLCEFDPKTYRDGYSYYALFDAIDCRVGYYLGYGLLYDSFKNATDKASDFPASGFLIFTAIVGLMFISPVAAVFNMIFIYVFLYTMMVRFIGVLVVYTIMLYFMCFISPIFIPMALFDQTKKMFEGWWKTTLSFALQPAVITAFMTLMITIYDKGLYGDCTFQRHTYPYDNSSITTFEITDTGASDACRNSYGYLLYRVYSGEGWVYKDFNWSTFKVVIPDYKFILESLKALILSYIIYKMAFNAQNLAAELTGGIAVAFGSFAEDGKKNDGAQDKSKQGSGKGASDKANTGGGASDKANTGGGGAADKASSGAGGAADMVKR